MNDNVVRIHAAKRLVDRQVLFEYLNCRWPVNTLSQWALYGKIPSKKINGSRVFDLDEIDKWLSEPQTGKSGPSLSKFQEVRERLRSLKTESNHSTPLNSA